MFVMGLDPGQKGGTAAIELATGNLVWWAQLPVCSLFPGSDRARVDAFSLIKSIPQEIVGGPTRLVVEDVSARPGQGVTSTFRFGFHTGVAVGALCALGMTPFFIPPATWKLAMGLSSDKSRSFQLARKLLNDEKAFPLKSRDEGACEAFLLARFARQRILAR